MPCRSCGAPYPEKEGKKKRHLLAPKPHGCIRYLRRQVDELREELEEIRDES